MPQLDKVTFFFQTTSMMFFFLMFHFYCFKHLFYTYYANLKMRETCYWWFDFDRDLMDWWFGEYSAFNKLILGWTLSICNLLREEYILLTIYPQLLFFFRRLKAMLKSKPSFVYFKRKCKKLKSFQ